MTHSPLRFLCLSTLCLGAAHADVVTLQPVADTTMFRNAFDPEADLSSGAGTYLFCGRTSGTNSDITQRALMRFDLSSIPAGATITSVSLRVQILAVPPGGDVTAIALHRVTSAWGEGASFSGGGAGAFSEPGDADWSHRVYPDDLWTAPGGDFAASPSATLMLPGTTGPVEWASTPELIADVAGWIAQPATNAGWLLHGNEDAFSTARRIASRDTEVEENRPVLRVEFSTCHPDYNHDTFVNSNDVADFLNQWFLDIASGTLLADYDNNFETNSNDVTNFLNEWFVGCG